MVFECQSTWNWSDLDEILEDYPCLTEYGIRRVDKVGARGYKYERLEIDVNSLEELIELSKKVGQPLIVNHIEPSIEIYDSYRE